MQDGVGVWGGGGGIVGLGLRATESMTQYLVKVSTVAKYVYIATYMQTHTHNPSGPFLLLYILQPRACLVKHAATQGARQGLGEGWQWEVKQTQLWSWPAESHGGAKASKVCPLGLCLALADAAAWGMCV